MPAPTLPDLHTALGAGPPAGALQITVFIPSVDRHGQPIDQMCWREETLRVLGVTCYVPSTALDQKAMATLRAFLHRLGREGNQGEVGVVIGDEYFGITEYDQEEVRHGTSR